MTPGPANEPRNDAARSSIYLAAGEITYVDVDFRLSGAGTLLLVNHRGWSTLSSEHRVRRGQKTGVFLMNVSRRWRSLLQAFGEYAHRTRPRP